MNLLEARAPLYTDVIPFVNTGSTSPIRLNAIRASGHQTLVLHATADCYVKLGDGASAAVTSSNGFVVSANLPVKLAINADSCCIRARGVAGAGSLYAYVEQSPGLSAFGDVLGSLLVDEWHRDSGVDAAIGWYSRKGRKLSPSGGPAYAADGTNFNTEPVPATATTGSKFWQGTSLTQLAANATRPYVAIVGRFNGAQSVNANLCGVGSGGTQYAVYTDGTNFNAYLAGTAINFGARDSNVHFFEIWMDGTNANFSIDGVNLTSATAGTVATAITDVSIGCSASVGVSTAFVSRFLFCSSAPTAGQRGALLNAARKLDNF